MSYSNLPLSRQGLCPALRLRPRRGCLRANARPAPRAVRRAAADPRHARRRRRLFDAGHREQEAMMNLPARFWSKVRRDKSGCWIWTGYRTKRGYGGFWFGSASKRAHRVAYEAVHGAIPAGLVLDHLCRNPSCVNPDHLEPVTDRENLMRGDTLATQNSTKTQCPEGHNYEGRNLVINNGKRHCRSCALIRSRDWKRWRRGETLTGGA
jgi:hypothetical protein